MGALGERCGCPFHELGLPIPAFGGASGSGGGGHAAHVAANRAALDALRPRRAHAVGENLLHNDYKSDPGGGAITILRSDEVGCVSPERKQIQYRATGETPPFFGPLATASGGPP